MPSLQKLLLVVVPLLVVSCLLASFNILYASPETLYPVVANKIWPASKNQPSSQGEQVAKEQQTLHLPELRALCARTRWNPDLAVHCHSRCGPNQTSFCGGINNARDRLQTCLRLAVDAGATTIVIPSLAARSEKRLATINPAAVAGAEDEILELCADAWFAVDRLQETLSENCPQIRVKMVCGSMNVTAARLVGAPRALEVPWRSSGEIKYDTRAGHTFREAVEKLLSRDAAPNSASTSAMTLVEVGDTYTAWDYKRSDEQTTIFKDLFQAVDFSPELRALGRRIITQHRQLREEPYIGVHLRGENDWPAAWGSLEAQTRLYIGDIETLRLRDEARGSAPVRNIYVSCGNRTSIQYFRSSIEPLGYAVFDKWSLLEGAAAAGDWPGGLEAVETLSFDEKAIVEYEPLVSSRYFLGISYSSMSFVIATARTLREPGDFMDVWVVGAASGSGGEADGRGKEEKGINEVRGNEHTRLIYVNIE